jgi:A/G-specific adenine glycosylase
MSSFTADLLRWFRRHRADLPWRRDSDPYRVWLSEIMLQQTQVAAVIPYYERFLRHYPTVQALAAAPLDEVLKRWEGLGYYSRARNLHRAAQVIAGERGGEWPRTAEELRALPGVGPYTAGAIASIAFGQDTPVLDGNVMRVLTRLFAIRTNPRETKTNARLWQLAEELVVEASRGSPCSSGRASAPFSTKTERSHVRCCAEKRGLRTCSAFNQSLMEIGAMTF